MQVAAISASVSIFLLITFTSDRNMMNHRVIPTGASGIEVLQYSSLSSSNVSWFPDWLSVLENISLG
jgi:hypothetical protein